MRNDLNKQLCERERYDSHRGYRDVRHTRAFGADIDDDDEFRLPCGAGSAHREGMKYRYDALYTTKTLNENLSPLWGFLHKSVGRPWNKIYSEICSSFDKRSVINQHILVHLYQRVEVNVKVDDYGELYIITKYSSRRVHVTDWTIQYYVDPRDGILKENKHYQTYKQFMRERAKKDAVEKAKVCRVVDSTTELHLIDGVWFEVKFHINTPRRVARTRPSYSKRSAWTYYVNEYVPEYDVLKKALVSEAKVAYTKRTLSKKELKQFKLVD